MSREYCIKKRTKGKHLRYPDRQKLEWYIRENQHLSRKKRKSPRELAALLETSPATMTRELRRGEVELLDSQLRTYKSYSAEVAQADYVAKGSAKGKPLKIGKDHAFAQYVEEKILKNK